VNGKYAGMRESGVTTVEIIMSTERRRKDQYARNLRDWIERLFVKIR